MDINLYFDVSLIFYVTVAGLLGDTLTCLTFDVLTCQFTRQTLIFHIKRQIYKKFS